MAVCPAARRHGCWEWARIHMNECICGPRDAASLGLGFISVASWGVAEIPQIITNFKDKSTDGLSFGFLITWILGDVLNLVGCKLEPATLSTQYYMAMLYTLTTFILTAQAVYYTHIYPRLKCRGGHYKGTMPSHSDTVEKLRQRNNDECPVGANVSDRRRIRSDSFGSGNVSSSPIPFHAKPARDSPERESFYMSARSLSKSHTPTERSYLAPRTNPGSPIAGSPIEQPLLGEQDSSQSSSPQNTKPILCLVSAVMFIGMLNIHPSADNAVHLMHENTSPGFVLRLGRKLSEVSDTSLQKNVHEGDSGVGTFLGWGMAAVYMGGRLPQICLNIRRGNVEGLNPLMFMFALVGNATYVASILVNSTDWSKLRPNLPWLVDAGGCMLLDSFIIMQFTYFHFWGSQQMVDKQSNYALA